MVPDNFSTPAEEDQPPLPPAVSVEPRYKGVGGWLLLFCLSLTVFSPLITLGSFAASYYKCFQHFHRFPGLLVIAVIDTLLIPALVAFSIYAGVALWHIRPGAVRTAKRFLLSVLGYQAIAAVLPFMAGLPPAATGAIIIKVVDGAMTNVAFVAIWYSYLNKSERVKATYQS
jgi:hypothetical protein